MAARTRGTRNRFRSRSLGAAAATLTASGAAAPASAAVIFDLGVSYSPNDVFDLTGDAASTIELFTDTGMAGDLELGLEAGGGMMATVEFSFFDLGMGSPDYLTLHSPSETVGGSLAFSDQVFLVRDSVTNPDWAVDTTGYAGFTFDLGSGPLYGWMQIHFNAAGNDFTVQQWAYDDAGAPITVAAIPEPSVVILLGLGVVALAAAWKRGVGGAPDAVG